VTGIAEMFAELTGEHEYTTMLEGWARWRQERERQRVRPRTPLTRARDRAYRAAYVARNLERVREWNRRNARASRARKKQACSS
jgi:hypothetical protein